MNPPANCPQICIWRDTPAIRFTILFIALANIAWTVLVEVKNDCIPDGSKTWIATFFLLLYLAPFLKTIYTIRVHRFCGTYAVNIHVLFEVGVYVSIQSMAGFYSYYTRTKNVVWILLLTIALIVQVCSFAAALLRRSFAECPHGDVSCHTESHREKQKHSFFTWYTVMVLLDGLHIIIFILWAGTLVGSDTFIGTACSAIP